MALDGEETVIPYANQVSYIDSAIIVEWTENYGWHPPR